MKKLSLVVAGLLIVGTTSVFAAGIGSRTVQSDDGTTVTDIGRSNTGTVNVNGVINQTDVTEGSTVSASTVGTKIISGSGEVNMKRVVNDTSVNNSQVTGGSSVGMKLENAGDGGKITVDQVINETNVNNANVDSSKVGMAVQSHGNQIDVKRVINHTDIEGGTVSGSNVGLVVD